MPIICISSTGCYLLIIASSPLKVFPFTALCRLFGMFVSSGVERFGFPGFWVVFISGIVLGFLIKSWVLKK